MSKIKIDIPNNQIKAFCEKFSIIELELFGSVLRDDFTPNSDIDVLVTFDKNVTLSLFDMVRLEKELSTIFNREVDVVEKYSVEQSSNYIRRRNILASMESVYVAR